MAGETYDRAAVMAVAVELDGGDKIAEVALQAAETAWNPLSTKGPLYGPQIVKFVIARSGITVGLYKLGRCVGFNHVRRSGSEHYEWEQCPEKVGKAATRCDDHKITG